MFKENDGRNLKLNRRAGWYSWGNLESTAKEINTWKDKKLIQEVQRQMQEFHKEKTEKKLFVKLFKECSEK